MGSPDSVASAAACLGWDRLAGSLVDCLVGCLVADSLTARLAAFLVASWAPNSGLWQYMWCNRCCAVYVVQYMQREIRGEFYVV